MIQNLISQPSSPLCNPKPVPVSDFNLDAFMGQWYQVIISNNNLIFFLNNKNYKLTKLILILIYYRHIY